VPAEDQRLRALLDAQTRLVRATEAERALGEDAQAWLEAGGLGSGDAAELAALGPRRLLVYRRHVRRALHRAVRQEIPRTAARLGPAFAPWVERWIDEESPRSRYFRDVAFELVAWAVPQWREGSEVPAYLCDLARHELAYFDVASAPDEDREGPLLVDTDRSTGEAPDPRAIALDRGVRFAASARLCRYDHAVHRLDAALEARDEPAREPTALLAYRDAEHDVHFLELTPLAAGILGALLRGEPLGQAVVGACAAQGHPLDPAVTHSTAALLGDLLERGAIVGGEAC